MRGWRGGGGQTNWEDRVDPGHPVCVQSHRLEDVGDVEGGVLTVTQPTKLLAWSRLLYDELRLAD